MIGAAGIFSSSEALKMLTSPEPNHAPLVLHQSPDWFDGAPCRKNLGFCLKMTLPETAMHERDKDEFKRQFAASYLAAQLFELAH